jgi:dUTPase
MQPPPGYGIILKERSSITNSKWPMILQAGVMDADYTGEWMISFLMHAPNISEAKSYAKELVMNGKAIVQALVVKKYTIEFWKVDKLEETSRGNKGNKGFGSSDN